MSRKLDAAIARALGYKWDESRCRICGWPIVPEGEAGCWKSNCSVRPRPEKRADEPPHYSTDGNDMLLLDREMRERDYWLGELRCSHNMCPGITSFYCTYAKRHKWGGPSVFTEARANTEPLARALAAHKALTGEDWKEEAE